MHDLKAYAVRKTGVIEVSISGMLPDSCHEAVVEDKYPGGKRVYVRDPGVAQVFIKERKRPGSNVCLMMLVPWVATVKIKDGVHNSVGIYVNGKKKLTVDVAKDPLQYQVIALIGDPPFGCSVIPANAVYPMIYRRVYGPASKEECSAWLARSCAKHPDVS